jgi:hypothetical protein
MKNKIVVRSCETFLRIVFQNLNGYGCIILPSPNTSCRRHPYPCRQPYPRPRLRLPGSTPASSSHNSKSTLSTPNLNVLFQFHFGHRVLWMHNPTLSRAEDASHVHFGPQVDEHDLLRLLGLDTAVKDAMVGKRDSSTAADGGRARRERGSVGVGAPYWCGMLVTPMPVLI